MNDKQYSDPLQAAWASHPVTFTNGLNVSTDPGMAQLRRYLPVLAVIAAPYAGLSGDQDPIDPLDRLREWDLINRAFAAASEQAGDGASPLALVRLVPPTAEALGQALETAEADAFRVVHLVCNGERDMLYLEADNGHEAYAVAERVVNLFEPGGVRLVIMDGCFSRRIGQMLIDETGVEAVIGTRRRVTPGNSIVFYARLYAALAEGAGYRDAFRAAVGELKQVDSGQADRYEQLLADDAESHTLPLPSGPLRAAVPLVNDGLPCMVGVPPHDGFVGRRDMLTHITGDVLDGQNSLFLLDGLHGVGKTWLAAELAGRLAWQFPDGVLWYDINAQTTTAELVTHIARLAALPESLPADELLAHLQTRRVLLVLDRLDMLARRKERDRLAAFLSGLIPGTSAVIATARRLEGSLAGVEAARTYTVDALSPRAARTLAMRLAVERNVDALDVDTIDDFLDRTLNLPWLIVKGVDLIESDGIDYAFEDLDTFKPDMPNPLAVYLGRWLKLLAVEGGSALGLLVRLQGLSDAFDRGLVEALAGDKAADALDTLLKTSLLETDHNDRLYAVPSLVQAHVRRAYPLPPDDQQRVDQRMMRYLAQTWPEPTITPHTAYNRAEQARINNTRTLIQRQIYPDESLDPATLDTTDAARLLAAAAPAFWRFGLAEEFVAYAHAIRDRLPEGPDDIRLQTVMGAGLSLLPGREDEAGWALQMAHNAEAGDPAASAEACRAYGDFLVQRGQLRAAERVLARGLQSLLKAGHAYVALASALAHDWANVLVQMGQPADAEKRFKAALAGYGELQRSGQVDVTLDYAEALVQSGDVDRAEPLLREVIAEAGRSGHCAACGRARYRLALLHMERGSRARTGSGLADSLPDGKPPDAAPQAVPQAAWVNAERELNGAVIDFLAVCDRVRLASAYRELGRVQAQLHRLGDARANIERSRRLFSQANMLPDLAAVLVTLGQVCLVQGDSVVAQEALHEALDLAAILEDDALAGRAAAILVRVHQIRARHIPRGDSAFWQNTLDQASFSRATLAGLGLDEHTAALDAIIERLSGAQLL
ncbi:MAG: tetratricopeptide repeat protein [Anaerolineae bacterium]|nr:tetratricopeptide repeat protein [Anaerolineae bacterium]